MATRKCGNVYFPKYLWPSGRFLRLFFSRIIWVGGVKNFPWKISSGAQSEDLGSSLMTQEFFSNKYSWFYMQRM